MEVQANVEDRVRRPVNEAFAAIVDPAKMSQYFITSASGPLKAGTTVEWEFADVGARVPVDVIEVEENKRIVYESSHTGPRTRTLTLSAVDPDTTCLDQRDRLAAGSRRRAPRPGPDRRLDLLPVLPEGVPAARDQPPPRPGQTADDGIGRAAA